MMKGKIVVSVAPIRKAESHISAIMMPVDP